MSRRVKLPDIIIHDRFTAQALAEQIPWSVKDFGVPEAWKKSRGRGVVVGIVDTGIDEQHAEDGDLAGAIIDTRDFSNSRKSGPRDVQGHGSHVAGITAAREGNGQGVAGVAPDCKLLIAKALGDDGGGSASGVAAAIRWCVDQGSHVINCSLGSDSLDIGIYEAVKYAASKGVFVICAAGNTGQPEDVNYPARFDECIAVAALDRQARLASFSSRGPQIDVAWPGQQIISTYLNGGYGSLSGTSMASPGVAGLVALRLAWEIDQGGIATKTVPQLLQVLRQSSKDLGTPGIDSETGWGVVVPGQLVPDAIPQPPLPPPPDHLPPTIGSGIWVEQNGDLHFLKNGRLITTA